MDVKQLGKAYAWERDGRWYFTPSQLMAPPEAIEVDRYAAEGKTLLYHPVGQHGRFIRGAEQVE